MKQTLQDIQVNYNYPISIVCDNISAISISKNLVMYSKTKHILIKFHFLWEQVAENNINVDYVGTNEQIADIFTKSLPRETFEYLRQKPRIVMLHNDFHNISAEKTREETSTVKRR